ncbi:hypothetical protein SAMN05421820_102155 [Pedobacter steynii]|uniref:Uncharacterized protein n=1 Tax=Pedobacter steynii TaxID=430522 RepID=A0A1G9MXQ6_9SPHI|nr:hypothetical protein [Pedobacter steynii]NQX39464.1 hypothetical protein [Pedobacter steynii]SDL79052.1 hypothetical protein SAMN05421820_102155 [Pedobacter steynii]
MTYEEQIIDQLLFIFSKLEFSKLHKYFADHNFVFLRKNETYYTFMDSKAGYIVDVKDEKIIGCNFKKSGDFNLEIAKKYLVDKYSYKKQQIDDDPNEIEIFEKDGFGVMFLRFENSKYISYSINIRSFKLDSKKITVKISSEPIKIKYK